MSLFSDYVDAESGCCDQLPLIHTSSFKHFHAITQNSQISPVQCDKFGEPLIYLFYGRPAYRPQGGNESVADFALCPISFIFRPHRFNPLLRRAYPFDSGAAINGKYSPHCDGGSLPDYLLSNQIPSLQKLVVRFFGNNANYFAGNLKELAHFAGSPTSVQRYLDLLRDPSKGDVDDRRYSIEVQVENPISLKDWLLAVVLPASFLSDPLTKSLIRETWSALPIVYETYNSGTPSRYYQSVLDKVREFYRSHGWL